MNIVARQCRIPLSIREQSARWFGGLLEAVAASGIEAMDTGEYASSMITSEYRYSGESHTAVLACLSRTKVGTRISRGATSLGVRV